MPISARVALVRYTMPGNEGTTQNVVQWREICKIELAPQRQSQLEKTCYIMLYIYIIKRFAKAKKRHLMVRTLATMLHGE